MRLLQVPTLGGFVQFLLTLAGIAFLAAGTWNLPRHALRERLELREARFEEILNELQRRQWEYRRRIHALFYDSYYRERILRRFIGAHLRDEQTLLEWLDSPGSTPGKCLHPKDPL